MVGPGWLLYRAINPGTTSRAVQLALGWSVGLTLEILAFSFTAAIGARDLFAFYPLVVAIPALLVLRRRLSARGLTLFGGSTPQLSEACARVVGGLCLFAFAYIAVAYYAAAPFPGTVSSVSYGPDVTYHIALAAEALHHWPMSSPNVVGQPLDYHYFAHIHVAAISQVTGIELPRVYLRLFLLPLVGLLTLQFSLLGKAMTGKLWAAPLTVALFLLIHEIDLSIADASPAVGIGMFWLWESPSQLLGMVIFAPALLVLCALLDRASTVASLPGIDAQPRELLAVLAILLIGAGGAKVVILPLLVGGLAIYAGWIRIRMRRWDRLALSILGLCVVAFIAYVAILYGRQSRGNHFDLTGTAGQMAPLLRLHAQLSGVPDVIFWSLAVPVGALMYFGAPLLGLVWLRRDPVTAGRRSTALALSILGASLPAFFLLQSDAGNQTYFTAYALIATYPLAAAGLLAFFGEPERRPALRAPRAVVFVVAWLGLIALVSLLADRLAVRAHPLEADALQYGVAAVAIFALGLGAVLARGTARTLLGTLAVLAILLTAASDTPLDVVPKDTRKLLAGDPLYDQQAGLRRATSVGLEWVRDNLDDDAVLAVRHAKPQLLPPLDADFPAFGEHRTLREAWAYGTRGNNLSYQDTIQGISEPFARRERLQREVFRSANETALRKLIRRYGVTHLLIERPARHVDPAVYRMGRTVYRNGGLIVLALPPA